MKHLIIILLLFPLVAFAGKGTWEKRVNLLDIQASPYIYDMAAPTRVGQDSRDYSSFKGYVFLDYTRKEQSDLTTPSANYWRATLKYKIANDVTNTIHELKISYEGGKYVYSDYKDVGALTNGDFGIIVIRIEGEYSTNLGASWNYVANAANSSFIPNDIDFRIELRSEEWYNLNVSSATDQSRFGFNNQTYRANWSYVQGAEWYDFEWVFIDDESDADDELTTLFGNLTDLAGNLDAAFDLKEPTRVRVWGTNYTLDKAYPKGTLYFRVRSVSHFVTGSGSTGQLKLGDWNYFYNPTNYGTFDAGDIARHIITTDFEPTKNWLYGVSFAENGKNVSSVSYYDGSNRARQGISYNTSDNVSLVGETKFDREGRQTISIIPAPVPGRQLLYRADFNLDNAGNTFDEEDFDKQNYIVSPTLPLAETNINNDLLGAAQYFSQYNQFTGDQYRDAIPAANGYVFSQTIYRNDGSGRIERVGGIGEAFQVDGDHAIVTYYGSPTEIELKRLFGNNVSDDPTGYRKEMVKDANDQYSVTYYDKRGNVIATGLSGVSPSKLLELEDADIVATIVTDLNNNYVSADGYSLISETTFLNGMPNNPVEFHYDMTGIVNQLQTQPVTIGSQVVDFGDLCNTCRYDWSIKVLDLNNDIVDGYSGSIDPLVACTVGNSSNPADLSTDFSIPLEYIGEYRIIKTLTVDVASMQAAFDANLTALGLDNPEDFIQDYIQFVDLSGCFDNCEDYCTAMKKLEYIQTHAGATIVSANAYWAGLSLSQQEIEIASCLATACNTNEQFENFEEDNDLPPVNPMDYACESNSMRMKQQLSPNGIFYSNPSDAIWVQAQDYITAGTNPKFYEYYDSDGNGVNEVTSLSYLQNAANFQNEWLAILLPFHREYCHLAYCDDWAETMNYSNQQLNAIYGAGWSQSANFFTTIQGSGNTDPFINSDFNSGTLELIDIVDSYLTDHQAGFSSSPCSVSSSGNLFDYIDEVVDCIETENLNIPVIWSADMYLFMRRQLFIGMYNSIKEDIIKAYKLEQSPACVYYTDYEAVFIGPRTIDEMTEEVEQMLSNILNPQECQERAIANVDDWLEQLPVACLSSLSSSDYNPAYVPADLIANTNSNNLEQLFYNYSIQTCPENTYGWFYNPDPTNDVNTLYDGEIAYNAIITMLSGCGIDPLPFEVNFTPGTVVTDYTNQQFSDCFMTYVELLNDGLQTINAASITPVDCSNLTNFGDGSYIHPIEITSTNYSDLIPCGLNNNSVEFYKTICTNGEYWMGIKNLGDCTFKIYTDLIYTSVITSEQYYILSLSNPIKHSSYVINNTPWYNVITFDALLSDGTIGVVYMLAEESTCLEEWVGDFGDQVILDFDGVLTIPTTYQADCFEAEIEQAKIDAANLYNELLNDLQNDFLASLNSCIANVTEHFTMSYNLQEYQYTLYYYDLAGNLVQTVPPQGVDVLSSANANQNDDPIHRMETRYQYNGLNSLIASYTPDGGRSDLYLDKLYRVRYSQNARQVAEGKASYSKYDELGRVTEAGEFKIPANDVLAEKVDLTSYPTTGILDYTQTIYEEGYVADASIATQFGSAGQQNLRNAIGAVIHRQADYGSNGIAMAGTEVKTVLSYSYDPHKNVKQVVSTNYQLAALAHQHKKVEYNYDLLSGNVNEVVYQQGASDQYRHKYHYDANNRLVRAFTSKNDETWEMDAKYFYYLHGALARTETGHDKVQGTDYAYNLQGWLKGVNSTTLDKSRDIGKDGVDGSNKYGGIDVFGFGLSYFENDYLAIKDQAESTPDFLNDYFASTQAVTSLNVNPEQSNAPMGSLYNGNISNMVTALRNDNEVSLNILSNNYKYDQLQRIREMKVYYASNLLTSNDFSGAGLYRPHASNTGTSAYQESYTFDRNGNLKTLKRNGSGITDSDDPNSITATTNLQMDDFSYRYKTTIINSFPNNPDHLNQLAMVLDAVSGDPYSGDVESGQLNSVANYQYDESGQLVKDIQEGIDLIEWTVTGKVKKITFTSTAKAQGKHDMKFIYDPMDMRIAKVEYLDDPHTKINYTYYSYDASGNVMATYDRSISPDRSYTNGYVDQFTLADHHIYGSSRIGTEAENLLLTSRTFSCVGDPETGTGFSTPGYDGINHTSYEFTYRKVSDKNYELSNHLGNVLAVVTDRKIAYITTNNPTIYTADVVSYSDYSPYGTLLHHRHGQESTTDYRYGFQGQEADDEIKGEGNSYNYTFRMHDPRIGRFFAVDPLESKYPHYTPYSFSGNKLIAFVELEGCEELYYGVNQSGDFMLLSSANSIIDAFGNLMFLYWKYNQPYANTLIIKAKLLKEGYDLTGISDSQIAETFDLYKADRTVYLVSERSFLEDLGLLAISSLEVVGSLPLGKGGAVATMTVRPVVSKAVSKSLENILRALKYEKRKGEIAKFIDANKKLIRSHEADAAALVENYLGGTIKWISSGAGDFVFLSGKYKGKVFDHMGMDPNKMANFKMNDFLKSIDNHFNKSIDYLLLDLRALSKSQKQVVWDHIKKNHAEKAKTMLMTLED